jgi:AraC-like DNA-binding protein
MKYIEVYPSKLLGNYIQCIWLLTGNPDESKTYGRQMLIPNESVEIVFNFADSFPDTLHKAVSDKYSSYIVGPITKTGSTDFQGEVELLGITFRPGMAYPFIQNNITEIRNTVVPLSRIWKELEELYEEIRIAKGLQQKCAIIERECFKKIDAFSYSQFDHWERFFSYINNPLADTTFFSVRELVERIGYSERTLERRFPLYFGLSPKEYLRIKRINSIAKNILVEKVDIYQAIITNNLVDYSHLIKELKHFDYPEFSSKPFAHTDFVSSYLAS